MVRYQRLLYRWFFDGRIGRLVVGWFVLRCFKRRVPNDLISCSKLPGHAAMKD